MPARSRREFLAKGSMGLMCCDGGEGGGRRLRVAAGADTAGGAADSESTPGAPGAFGTSPSTGPEVSGVTVVQAEKLVQVEMSGKDLAEAAWNWRQSMAAVYERRVGPRKLAMGYDLSPATVWNPLMPKVQWMSELTCSLTKFTQIMKNMMS